MTKTVVSIFCLFSLAMLVTGCKKELDTNCPAIWTTNNPAAIGTNSLQYFNSTLAIRNYQGNINSNSPGGIGMISKDATMQQTGHSIIPFKGKWVISIPSVFVADMAGAVEINFRSNTKNAGSIIFRADSIVSQIPGHENELPVNFARQWQGYATNLTAELWFMPDFDLGFKLINGTDTLSGIMPYFNSGSINVAISVKMPSGSGQSSIVLDKVTANDLGQTKFDDTFDCATIAQ